jgi:hypothetical protein
LPHEETELVAEVVKDIALVDAAAPDTDGVLMAVACELQPGTVALRCHAGQEGIGGYPVATTTEEGHAVDLEEVQPVRSKAHAAYFKEKARARLVLDRFFEQSAPTQADLPLVCSQDASLSALRKSLGGESTRSSTLASRTISSTA